MTPVYGIAILLTSTLMLHLADGPLWRNYVEMSENCEKNWWTNMLYVNTFVNKEE